MFYRDFRGAIGHRRIDENRQIMQPALPRQAMQVIKNLLGATHREGGNDDIAATFAGLRYDRDHLINRRGLIAMHSIAIGRFHDQDIGLGDRRRVAQNRPPRLTQVAAEYQLYGFARFGDPQLDDCRTENVTAIAESADHIGMWRKTLIIRHLPHLPEAGFGIAYRVDRGRWGRRRPGPVAPPALCPFGLRLLDMGAIWQHHLKQIGGGGGGQDRTTESVLRQFRQHAAMVNMRMRQQHEIQGTRIKTEMLAVARVRLAPTLNHAAIDQKSRGLRLDQIA